jgi:poly-gamma-glutamate synthase PgsB/CapB
MAATAIHEQLASGLTASHRKLQSALLHAVADDFSRWSRDRERATRAQEKAARRQFGQIAVSNIERRDANMKVRRQLLEFIGLMVEQLLERLQELDQRHVEFRRTLANTLTERERRRVILEYARDLGARPRQLRGDARAFDRWFGDDAVTDRYSRSKGATEQELVFYLDRLGAVLAQTLTEIHDPETAVALWQRLEVEKLIHAVLQYRSDPRVEMTALRCLTTALRDLPKDVAESTVSDRTRFFVERAAMDTHRDVSIQSEAIGLLEFVAPQRADRVISIRLRQPKDADDMFVRRRCVRLLGARLREQNDLIDLVAVVAEDPSSFVRQQLAEVIRHLPTAAAVYWWRHLALEDADPKVRAATLTTAIANPLDDARRAAFLELLAKVLESELDPFVLRTALYVVARGDLWETDDANREDDRPAEANGDDGDIHQLYRDTLVPAIRKLQVTAESLQVRRWAAQAGERIWAQLDPRAQCVLPVLRERLAGLRAGKGRRISKRRLQGCDETTLGRALAVLAQDDFGWDLRREWLGFHVTRGPVFRFRLWRFLYEMLTPSTDKRQGFLHTIGRVSEATIRAPSQVLAELSQTKVPGEPLFMPEEGSWRPYLPLADDILSTLDVGFWRPRPVRFFNSEGVTEVMPPSNLGRRAIAYFHLTVRFAHYAQLRNWREGETGAPEAYLQSLQQLGFRVRLQPHNDLVEKETTEDPSVVRFFPLLAPLGAQFAPPLKKYLLDFADYFGSSYANTLLQLLIFITMATLFFLGKHFYSNWTLRRARQAVGLSIGGWGTRGKSGTERLKAALFNALGCGVVSKSTGCEAMFMYSHPFGELREMLLYRPYDKATIWEHRNVLKLAAELKASVFLWECMGLTPSYIEVLQQQWSCDDLATITNAYPDHEDVQGPAGWNVASVIAGFVPWRSRILTTEQQMLPLLRDASERNQTSFRSVTWLESGLLTDDVLDRCPYKEHPDNVALVLAMADDLGCDRDYALKVMADRLVPDLGVLKTYPPVNVRSRVLEFTNGMSANERFGCMGNWERMGYAGQDHVREPNVWISTVVNNRADRVPRSRSFAKMLVNDLSADRHFLIGNNLKGLQGFVWEAFAEMSEGLSLWNDESGNSAGHALDLLRRAAHRYRQPYEGKHVQAALAGMLQGLENAVSELPDDFQIDGLAAMWSEPDSLGRELDQLATPEWFMKPLLAHLSTLLDALAEYTTLADQIREGGLENRDEIDEKFRETVRRWFERKLVVIDDYDASGEEVIETVCEATPPGFLNRIMGVQNIKGTGLDFIYRWQAWEKCHQACQLLRQPKPSIAERGLRMLAEFQDFGLLCDEHVLATIAAVKRSPIAQRERFLAELDLILTNHQQAMQKISGGGATQQSDQNGITSKCLQLVEEFADVSDAVKRRKTADQIYRDLATERISGERAVLELRALNKRQKGGWLSSKLRSTKPSLAVTQPASLSMPSPANDASERPSSSPVVVN